MLIYDVRSRYVYENKEEYDIITDRISDRNAQLKADFAENCGSEKDISP